MSGLVDNIRISLIGLKMPRALEELEHIVQRLEKGEIGALEAIDALLAEEFGFREGRRIGIALTTARLTPPKTLENFDFTFQPSLDKNRIMALASLDFIARAEVVHFLGPPGTGKSHLATALGVAAVKAGKSVYRTTLAELIETLSKAEREGRLIEKIRFYARTALLIVDEIGYLPISTGGANLFFQLVNARYESGAEGRRERDEAIQPMHRTAGLLRPFRPRNDAGGDVGVRASLNVPGRAGKADRPPRLARDQATVVARKDN